LPSPLLITGASGRVGARVATLLAPQGHPLRLATRDPRAAELGEAVPLDFLDAATWARAFDGVETMFLMRPPQLSNVRRDLVPALEAARSAGVRHVVFLSLQGAEGSRVVPHARIESWLRGSGMAWTFVRPSFFMENLSTTHAVDIRDDDRIMLPAGRGATSLVATEDVAAVAATALADPAAHAGRAWTPTGPAALTYAEVAEVLSDVLGRPISDARPGALRYAWHAHRRLGMPWGMAAVTTAIYSVARLGKADGLTDDVRTVLGREPIGFQAWARANAGAWRRPG